MIELPPVLLVEGEIKRNYLWNNPEWLFFFGDNLKKWGRKGQAKAMRGEKNALGVPTKASPSTLLYDNDESPETQKAREFWIQMGRLNYFSYGWKHLVIPAVWELQTKENPFGITIGTGLARMPEVCPHNFSLMMAAFTDLLGNFGFRYYTVNYLFESGDVFTT